MKGILRELHSKETITGGWNSEKDPQYGTGKRKEGEFLMDIKNTLYIYTALFLDREELFSNLQKIERMPLKRDILYPHVTFAYRPERIRTELFGVKAEILCTGYGCDGRNEGLKVVVHSERTDLMELYQNIELPHITLSLSEHAKAVDTGKLDFRPIPPFTLTGTYGGLSRRGKPVTWADENPAS